MLELSFAVHTVVIFHCMLIIVQNQKNAADRTVGSRLFTFHQGDVNRNICIVCNSMNNTTCRVTIIFIHIILIDLLAVGADLLTSIN